MASQVVHKIMTINVIKINNKAANIESLREQNLFIFGVWVNIITFNFRHISKLYEDNENNFLNYDLEKFNKIKTNIFNFQFSGEAFFSRGNFLRW